VVAGESDLEFLMQVEVMPDFEPADVGGISVERMVATATDEEINQSLERLAQNNRNFIAKGETAEAAKGDAVVIDFAGHIDGVAFEGGSADGQTSCLAMAGSSPASRTSSWPPRRATTSRCNVTFPEDYPVDTLKGKPADVRRAGQGSEGAGDDGG